MDQPPAWAQRGTGLLEAGPMRPPNCPVLKFVSEPSHRGVELHTNVRVPRSSKKDAAKPRFRDRFGGAISWMIKVIGVNSENGFQKDRAVLMSHKTIQAPFVPIA